MNGKTLWSIIFGLVVVNCLTIGYFISKEEDSVQVFGVEQSDEIVATIGKESIMKDQWMAELETKYGKETLKELINQTVVDELAKRYKINVSDEVIEQELAVYKSMFNNPYEDQPEDDRRWRDQIRYSILLEEILTRDVTVPESELKSFYDNNEDLYKIEEAFRLSHIIVKTKEEAEKVLDELKGGSSFEALALEKSIDEITANSGGDIGFISKDNEYVPDTYLQKASNLNEGEWSGPLRVDNGFAVILLNEKLNGKAFTFNEVKGQIRRQIALEQMQGNVNADLLWDEIGVSWFYEEKK